MLERRWFPDRWGIGKIRGSRGELEVDRISHVVNGVAQVVRTGSEGALGWVLFWSVIHICQVLTVAGPIPLRQGIPGGGWELAITWRILQI